MSSFPASKPCDLSSSFDNGMSHTMYTSSRGEVSIPHAVLQRMVAAKNGWLRAGDQDARFCAEHLPDGKPTAIVSIRELMTKIDAARASGSRTPPRSG